RQRVSRHFLDLAALELAEIDRPEGDADQPHHRQVEMRQHPPDLAVLAFGQRDVDPGVAALLAVEPRPAGALADAPAGPAAGERPRRAPARDSAGSSRWPAARAGAPGRHRW